MYSCNQPIQELIDKKMHNIAILSYSYLIYNTFSTTYTDKFLV